MMQQFPKDIGWIEVICGSMYSGKTEKLIRRLKRALYGKQKVRVFKPQIDNRYDELSVVSHSQLKINATAVQRAHQILQELAPDTKVVGIDEVQFFGMEMVAVVQELAICVVCGNPANRSQHLCNSDESVLVGAAGVYKARCRKCHVAASVSLIAPAAWAKPPI